MGQQRSIPINVNPIQGWKFDCGVHAFNVGGLTAAFTRSTSEVLTAAFTRQPEGKLGQPFYGWYKPFSENLKAALAAILIAAKAAQTVASCQPAVKRLA